MNDRSASPLGPVCSTPGLNNRLTAYCFGDVDDNERFSIQLHLLECDICWEEVRRLAAAVEALRKDQELARTVSVEEVCSLIGISAKLDWRLGGHTNHVIIASVLYALSWVFGLISEVAYGFDQFGRGALWLSLPLFLWFFLTSVVGLLADWKLTIKGNLSGLRISMSGFASSAALAFAGLCFFLPDIPITQMTIHSQTARGAYLKGILYTMPLVIMHLLIPFHFVLAMQHELQEGRYRLALALLSGDGRSVTPEGAIHVRLRTLGFLLLVAFLVSIPLTARLFTQAMPSPYLGLFTLFIYLRWFTYFGLGLICLLWYSRAINELKRECLAAENVHF